MIKENNYAFIDGNNLHLGIQFEGWKPNYKLLRSYLWNKFSIKKAYYFLGYIPQNSNSSNLYHSLTKAGYILKFKRTKSNYDGDIKSNIDTDLVLNTLIRESSFDKALFITGDDDYYCLLRYLYLKNKFLYVMTPNNCKCPKLFKTSFIRKFLYPLYDIKEKIKYCDCPIKSDRLR